MKMVPFGSTGLKVSALCYGTMSFGGDADKETSAQLYKACRDAGINFFDTANVYSAGQSELILGELMAHERDNLIISSKGFGQMGEDINAKGATRRNILSSVEASLKRLNTDHLDVYFMHMWDPNTPLEETLRALEKLVSDGKVLHLGASNYAAWQVAKALGIANMRGWAGFDVLQPMYNLVKRQAESELLPLAKSEGLAVMPYSPLGGGVLSGKYVREQASETSRLNALKMYETRYGESWIGETALSFVEFCEAKNLNAISTAIAWVASHEAITCPIVGARNVDQLKPALNAIEMDMPADLRAEISALSRTPAVATDRTEEAG